MFLISSSVIGLTRSLLRDPHVGHADYAPSAGDPPVTHSFNFDNVQENVN